MNELEQLEKDLEIVKSRGGRPELIQKLEAQIAQLKDQDIKSDAEMTPSLDQQFEELFKAADKEIRSQYVEGTGEFIREHHPDLNKQISQADEKIQNLWKKGRKGEARIEDFSQALEKWKLLHIQANELFKAENT